MNIVSKKMKCAVNFLRKYKCVLLERRHMVLIFSITMKGILDNVYYKYRFVTECLKIC